MARHRGIDNGRQVALVIGGIGASAVALLLVVGWLFNANTPTFTRTWPTGAAPTAAMLVPRPTTSFVVPTPTFVTPSELPTGPRDPLLPPELANPQFPDATVTPSTSASPTPPRTTTPPKTTPPAQVGVLSFTCDAGRQGVRAVLRLMSTGPVVVSVTAAGETRTETVAGRATITATASAPNPRQATCSAVVAGRQLGPIPAR